MNKDVSNKFDNRKGIVFEPGYILYGKLRPYLNNWLFPNFKGIALGDFWVFESNNSSSLYNYYLIQSDKYQAVANLSSGTKMPRSDWKTVSDTIFGIPKSFEEQEKIGTFFKVLDDTIALHQRKVNALQQLKKGFLQKMFPTGQEIVPQIRFANFTGEWEQRKLGKVVKRVTRKNKGLESTLPLTISAQDGLVDQNTFFNKQVASRDLSNYYLLKKGDFAYNKSYSKDYPWGAVKRLDNYEKGVLSTLYIVFKPEMIDSDFLVTYYETNAWHKQVSMRAAEGARNHGLLNISAEDFFDAIIEMPAENNEQRNIGEFFKQIDKTITLHQSKLDELKYIKKSLLQKMFV